MRPVRVLLSTYNGSRFLHPLLESVLAQDYPHFEIMIRDDGSTDDTVTILRQYATDSRVLALHEQNIGTVRSFFRLLGLSASAPTYVAFCDQDDVWEQDKLSRAMEWLVRSGEHEPRLYCGRAKIVDEHLRLIGLSATPHRGPAFQNALVQNIAGGHTLVMNGRARELLLRATPSAAIMHDWWAYLVVSAFGDVIYDDVPKVLYRQHTSNVMGAQVGVLRSFRKRISRFIRRGNLLPIRLQAEQFRLLYGSSLDRERRRVLDRFLAPRNSLWDRVRYALSTELWRQSRLDDVILRILLSAGRV